jgi:cytochrome c oxidase subunit II
LRAVPFLTRSRTAFLAALAVLALALLLAPGAFATEYLTPRSGGGSPNAEKIDTLYKVAFGIGILIFLLVEGVLVYSLVKFRHRRGGPEPAQIRGNTPLEIGWTLGAAGILVILAVVTFIFLGGIKNPASSLPNGYVAEAKESGMKFADNGANSGRAQFVAKDQAQPPGPANKHLTIGVNGQQYLWRFNYPGKDQVFSYHDLVVPTGTTVVLNITASDVAHSWWIPDLGGKADAIPGHTNHTWFRIDKPGSYWGNCAEFCGENHADMTARVTAVSPDQYRAFLAKQAADIKQSQALLSLARKTRGQGGQ